MSPAWHSIGLEEVFARLRVRAETGLSGQEAATGWIVLGITGFRKMSGSQYRRSDPACPRREGGKKRRIVDLG